MRQVYLKKQEKSQIKNLTSFKWIFWKRKTKLKVSKKKDIKIREKINEIETKEKQTESRKSHIISLKRDTHKKRQNVSQAHQKEKTDDPNKQNKKKKSGEITKP